ncbi:MAG TPA: PRC-barrel domain-containing protein [Candidatus Limnocylindria bacterium]|nr:PRC-barrel domain-containing protein [Candidatus Limnocylindria bacterium]
MRIDLGAKVRTTDGHHAGHIKQAIWDGRRNEIIEYVVSTGGLLSHDAIVSAEMLGTAKENGGEVVLGITKHELDELARFEPAAYTTPPTDWLAPAAYNYPAGGYLFPVVDSDPSRMVEEPPRSDDLGRGMKIRRGMKVRDAAGEVVGEVIELRVDDETGELRGIVAEHEGTRLEIDAENVDRVDDDVRLAGAGSEIRGRTRT